MRYLVGSLGLALVVVGLVFWLVSIGDSKTTVLQTSTTTVSGAIPSDAKRTVVTSKKATTQPLERGSDAVVGLIVGTGGLLFLVFAFWGRITEIGLPGGGSIKVKEAEASTAGVEDAALAILKELPQPGAKAAPSVVQVMKDSSSHIVEKTKEIALSKEQVVVVGLGAGDKWLLANLYFLAYMLGQWTSVAVLVFTESASGSDALYVACGSPQALRDRLEDVQPELLQARAAATNTPLDQAGRTFFSQLDTQPPTSQLQPQPTWVTGALLQELAGNAVTTTSVEIKSRDELTVTELRAIVDFPYSYVPVTQARVLVTTVDQNQVALRLSRSALRVR
ncbi:MAG: hypothetical protein ACRDWY_18885 [Actinomycetes bacterium]|jgi:hypothetical protein